MPRGFVPSPYDASDRSRRPGGLTALRHTRESRQGPGADPRGGRPGSRGHRAARGVPRRLSEGAGLRCDRRQPHPGGTGAVPPLRRVGHQGSRPRDGGAGRAHGRAGRPRGGGRRGAPRFDAALRRPVLRPGGVSRPAPQADADRRRAGDLGHRRRLHDAGGADGPRPAGRGHLLGELHAAVPRGDVRQGRRHLVRADGRRPGELAGHHVPCGPGGALFRAQRQPVPAPLRSACSTSIPYRATRRTPC